MVLFQQILCPLVLSTLLFIIKVQAAVLYAPPVEISGYKFFDAETGESVAWKGIDYYPRPNDGPYNVNNYDFYTEEYRHIWERDISYFKQLGVNGIRIYAVDPSKNHDLFMCALQQAGIYAIVGISANCEDCAITNDAPPSCYPDSLKTRGQFLINEFARYENVLGFSAGNEVELVTPTNLSLNAPCLKKFVRDMRSFIDSCPSMRKIPVGLVVADINQAEHAAYYNCLTDPNDPYENAEWYGINAYRHCNGKVTDISQAIGLRELGKFFQNSSIPVILTEFGCLNDGSFPEMDGYESQRTFLQAKWLFEPEFHDIFSGGFVFEYSVERINTEITSNYPFTSFGTGNYGIGYFSPASCDDVNTTCVYNPKPEYCNLQAAYGASNARGLVTKTSFQPDEVRTGRPDCPANLPKLAEFNWTTDQTDNLVCTSLVSFTCPFVNIPQPPKSCPSTTDIPPTKAPFVSSPTESPVEMSARPTELPTLVVSTAPSTVPLPSESPSISPSMGPTLTSKPSFTQEPSTRPSSVPTVLPVADSTVTPSLRPSTTNPSTEEGPSVNEANITRSPVIKTRSGPTITSAPDSDPTSTTSLTYRLQWSFFSTCIILMLNLCG
jgi:hypothetical protein